MAGICYIIGIIVFIYAFRYASGKTMILKYPIAPRGTVIQVDVELSFLLYTILTTMFLLGPLSLIKYIVWIALVVILCISRYRCRMNIVLFFYLLFFLWCLYSLSYSTDVEAGFNMIIKYLLPFLYFWLGYNAVNSESDLYVFMKFTTWTAVAVSFLVGGYADRLYPGLYNYLLWDTSLFVGYAATADFIACVITIPLALFFLTNERLYFFLTILLLGSSVLDIVRTGIGGNVIAISLFCLLRFKFKAVPVLVLCVALFMASIFLVPEVKSKMFNTNPGPGTEYTQSFRGQTIAMNGRDYLWNDLINNFYKEKEIKGSGLGTALSYAKDNSEVKLIHSDYIQMLCEIGNIGLSLFVLFAVAALLKTISTIFRNNHNIKLTLVGGLSIGSLAGMLFCMAFDNVVTYAQQAYVIPFILLGVFQKCVDIELQ